MNAQIPGNPFARWLWNNTFDAEVKTYFRIHPPTPRRPRVLFVWVPKVAGTSVFEWLASELGMRFINHYKLFRAGMDSASPIDAPLTVGHMSVDSLIEHGLIDSDSLRSENFLSFTFVRNPFARQVSNWRNMIRNQELHPSTGFEKYMELVYKQKQPIGPFNSQWTSGASPMYSWIHQKHWPGPQKVFKIEEFPVAIDWLRGTLNIGGSPGHLNSGPPRGGSIPISSPSLLALENYCRQDAEISGYDTRAPEGLFDLR